MTDSIIQPAGVPVFKRRKPDGTPITDFSDAPGGVDDLPDLPAGAPLGGAPLGGTLGRPADSGLGVPPFRPAPPKEPHAMTGRPMLPTAAGHQPQPARPALPATSTGRNHPRDASERRTLVVGRGISVQGTVTDAERLVVEGTVEASMIQATELSIAPGGVFKGESEVEDAEIAGVFDGTLTVRGNLTIRSTGRILGTARCRRLQVEEGGQISGRMEMLTDTPRGEAVQRPSIEPAA